jgi:thioredoxin reductase (NADPH)
LAVYFTRNLMAFVRANALVAVLLHAGLLLVQGVQQLRNHNEFLQLLTQSHQTLVVVDYFSHSCPPCRMMAPVFERLSQEFAGRAHLAKIDVVENPDTTGRMGITSMPTFQFFLNGQMVHSFTCVVESQLRDMIAQLAPPPPAKATVPKAQASASASVQPASQKMPVAPADADACRSRRKNAGSNAVEQVVILGAGPAGTSAALYAGRSGLCPLVIAPTVGGQLLAKGVDVENYPGLPSGNGATMIDSMKKQAHGFSAEFVDDAVELVETSSRPFSIHTKSGRKILSHAVIVATGALTRWLEVDGEEKYKGLGVSGCATCDGFLFKGKRCAVIGGGDTAMEEALVLSRLCSSVAVIHRRDQFRASKVMQERLLADPKITVFYNRKVNKFLGDGKRLQRLELGDTSKPGRYSLELDAAFVAIGRDPNAGFLKNSVRLDSQGYLQVAAGSTRTSVNGIFAAGDVADHTYRQAITSAASGAMAAMDVEKYFSGAAEASEDSSSGLCSYLKGMLSGSFQLGCIGAMLSSTRL